MKTLLISTCQRTRQLLGEALERRGHEWTVLADAEAACATVPSDDGLLVILDLDLGVDRCAGACRDLRSLSRNGPCTILVAGDCSRGDDLEALLAAGADDFLTDLEDAGHLALRLAVAEKSRRKAALRESEQRFHDVLENMPVMLYAFDEDRNIAVWNRECESITGYSEEEIVGDPQALKRLYPDQTRRDHILARWHRDGQNYRDWEWNVRCKSGEVKTIAWSNVSKHFPVPGWASWAIGVDVTERREAERAVRRSEAKLRGLFENMPDFLILVDRDATIRFVNRGVSQTPAEALLGANGFSFIAPEHQESCRAAFERVFSTSKAQTVEMTDVFGVWWACRLVPMVEDGRVPNVMLICTDVTDLKTTSLELEKERRLLQKMLDLHERDRRLIAYEIHDGFAQQITGARFNLEAFDRLQEKNPEDARKLFHTGLELLSAGIMEARRLISGLRPPVLDELGVVAAVEYLVAEAREQGGPEIEFTKQVEFKRLARPLESAVFRIVQESLTNACRHSRSDRVHVKLLQRGDHLAISIHDWGVGFRVEEFKKDRFGLQGIRERARLMGGEAIIEAVTNEGTRVYVELPLVEMADESDEIPE
ncbi:MAG TPA: PAS domain S-box protein [Thermoguttaceae bacterium]|nr:PAS domain S-box protein [Thermoguttaceae bacterium]